MAEKPVPGQYIVVLGDDVATLVNERSRAGVPSVAQAAQQIAGQHGTRLMRTFTHVLRGFVVEADKRALASLMLDGRVAYVEEDGVVSIDAVQSGATWGIDRIDQRSLPLSSSFTYGTTASNVNVYIIDSGVLGTHIEFTGRMIAGYTNINDGRGTSDCNGHGTHVAGTVGGTIYGVAKGVKISPVRVMDCNGSGTSSGVIAGMDWVTANHVKPAVANMSLGGGASTATDDAVTRMTNAGVTAVVSAGNDAVDACNQSPARAAAALTVGATTNTDARASFSNYGTCLDLFAPGVDIVAAWPCTTSPCGTTTSTNTAANLSGTSMATPHVTGAAALYLAGNPSATPAQVVNAIVSASTPNKVTDTVGSANRLLYSGLFVGTPMETLAPSAPSSLAASAVSYSQVNLSWTASTDTGGSGVGGYKIERCAGAGCTSFTQIGWTPNTTFTSTGLIGGTSYSYRVRAYDYAGNNGAYSNTATVTPPADTAAPSAPSSLAAIAVSYSQVNLSWTASTDTGGSGVAGYTIERCAGVGCTNFAQIGTAWALSYSNYGVTGGTSYSYRVRAYDGANNNGSYSNTATVTPPADTVAPSAPTNLAASASYAKVNLSWTGSTDTGGSSLVGYKIERCSGAGCTNFAQIGTTSLSTTSFADTGLTSNTSYSYRVRGYDGAGNNSAYSNTATATTPPADTAAPSAPTNLAASVSYARVNLSWTASTDTGTSGLSGYKIERCMGVGCTTFAQIATTTATSYASTGLTSNTSYSYRVRAYDGAGNNSAYSNTVTATTPPADTVAPSVPSNLTASVASSTQVNLTWTASTDTGGSGLSLYQLERCAGVGCTTFALIAQTTATSYASTGLVTGTSYSYRVRARDAALNYSGYSNTATAKP